MKTRTSSKTPSGVGIVIRTCACVATLLLAAAAPARAFIAATSTATFGTSASPTELLAGWRFTVNSAIDVNALGIWDDQQNGLVLSHEVGIFVASVGTLLTSATVPSGTTAQLIDGTRWVVAPTVTLLPGTTYEILATNTGVSDRDRSILGSSITYDSAVNHVALLSEGSSNAFVYPASFGVDLGGINGYLGPNFGDLMLVPEPSRALLSLAGVAAAGLCRRRRGGSRRGRTS